MDRNLVINTQERSMKESVSNEDFNYFESYNSFSNIWIREKWWLIIINKRVIKKLKWRWRIRITGMQKIWKKQWN